MAFHHKVLLNIRYTYTHTHTHIYIFVNYREVVTLFTGSRLCAS
jgi:hypothetical protein